jgi:hypothetical protein
MEVEECKGKSPAPKEELTPNQYLIIVSIFNFVSIFLKRTFVTFLYFIAAMLV